MTTAEPEGKEAQPQGTEPRRRRWPWVVLGVLVVLAIVVAVTVAAAFRHFTSDVFVRAQILKAAGEYVNGTVSVENASVRVLRGMRIDGLRLVHAAWPDAPTLEIESVWCGLNPWSLVSGPVEPTRLVLRGLTVRIVRLKDGSLNVAGLVRPQPEAAALPEGLRIFQRGVFIPSARVILRNREWLGDDNERTIERVSLTLTPNSRLFDSFDFSGQVLEGALRGVRFKGRVDASDRSSGPDLRVQVSLPGLEIGPDLVAMLPSPQAGLLRDFGITGTVSGDVSLSYRAPARPSLSVELQCADMRCEAQDPPLSIRSLAASLRLDDRRMHCTSFHGRAWGGLATGYAILHMPTGEEKWPRFECRLDLDGASLHQIVSKMDKTTPLRGRIAVQMDARGSLRSVRSIVARGTADITEARLAELPMIAGLLNVLSLTLPSKTVFDRVAVRFYAKKGTIRLTRILISSPTVDVTGKGTLDFKGDADLIVVAATSERPGGIPILSKLFKIVIRGVQQTLLPPVRITGNLLKPDSLKYDVMTIQPIRKKLNSLVDLIPLLPSRDEAKDKEEEEKMDQEF